MEPVKYNRLSSVEPEGVNITSSQHVYCQLVLWELADVVEKREGCKKKETKSVLIPFVREGQATTDPGRQENKTAGILMLDQIKDWQLVADLEKNLKFPDIVPTNLRPDLVVWSTRVICLFVCLFWVYLPTREFFTHMKTLPLPVNGCNFSKHR